MGKNTLKNNNTEENSVPEITQELNLWQRYRAFSAKYPLVKTTQRIIKRAILFFFVSTIVMTFVYKFVPVWITPTMIDRKIEAISEGSDSEIHSDWEPYENISKEAALAVVASEDQLFPVHHGFDFESMWGAFLHNFKGKRIKGASTISQQVAKNVFLWQGRSYVRKVLEVYFTVLIELIWGKERILEVYLNIAEMGKMTFGVEATALKYYGHSANSLSRSEAARIAAVLPSPNRFSIKNPSNYVVRRTNAIARQMRRLGGRSYIKGL